MSRTKPKFWSNLSLACRLILSSGATLLLCSTIFVYNSIQDEISRNHLELAQKLNDEIESAIPIITESIAAHDYAALNSVLSLKAHREFIKQITWKDNHGRSIIASGKKTSIHAPNWFIRWTDMPSFKKAQPVFVKRKSFGDVTIELNPAQSINKIWQIFLNELKILFIGLSAFFVMTFAILRSGLRPLYALATSAERFGQGDYSVRIKPDGSPEMLSSVRAFNSMAASIQALLTSLQESETKNRRLATIVEQSGEAILTKDLDGKITSWNAAATKLFGYSAEEAIGKSVELLRLPSHTDVNDKTVIREGAIVTYETCRIHKEGKQLDIELSSAPLYDEDGAHIGVITIARDIAERKQNQAILFAEKERAQVTLESIGDAVITTDTIGNIEYLNPIAEKLTGWSVAEAKGKPLPSVFHVINEVTLEKAENPVDTVLREKRDVGVTNDTVLICRNGQKYAIEDCAAPIRDRDGAILGVILVFRDVSQARRMAHALSWQASHDALTGLFNRREFERRLDQLVENAKTDNKPHTLLYLDLDQFKIVNDTCGHVAGDELLRQVTSLLQAGVRDSDILARLGGDEFGVLLEGCATNQAQAIAESLRQTLSEFRFVWQDKTFVIGISIGLVGINSESANMTAVLSGADAACYSAKDKGRNRVQIYRPDDSELAQRRGEMQWVSRINRAFEEDRFCLYFQTIAPIGKEPEDGEHYELLLRMVDENGNVVPPMAFIPAAERYNLMPTIDRRVVCLAFEAYEKKYHGDSNKSLHTSTINLSGASLGDELFLDFLRDQFALYNVPPQVICFEITETAAIANLTRANKLMRELKALGCRFSLDDFGSGLSSFAYLKNLPVDYLKIDGSFVKDMENDPIDFAMVQAINNIGHVMGIRTIAEFVENDAIKEMLREIGVDYAQGYGIAKPQPLLESNQTSSGKNTAPDNAASGHMIKS